MLTTVAPRISVPSSILIVEDNEVDAELLKSRLRRVFGDECRCTVRRTLADTKIELRKSHPDFIILDLMLPDSEYLATLNAVVDIAPHVPLIVHTGHEDSALALEAMKRGAQDYMLKGRGDEFSLKRVIEYSVERKRLEREAAQNEEMLRTFFRHTPAAVATFDKEMRYLVASERWLRDYELESSEITGKGFYEVLPAAPASWKEVHQRCLQGEVEICPEDIFERQDGSMEWCRWEVRPWYVGKEIGGIIIFSEITTEQKKMKLALEESKRDLEKKVERRTKEIEKARLAAEAADKAKTELFTNLTHELRTPLHAIINFSKFGLKKAYDGKPEKIEGYFQDIHKSGQRLLRLVNDILDLAKAQSLKLKLEIEHAEIETVLQETVTELRSLLDDNGIAIETAISPALEEAYFDKSRIIQVLINLISNAIKFSESGTVITVATAAGKLRRTEDGSPGGLWISVADQGTGIPENELAAVFDEFAQSSKVKSGSFSAGTGLGLAICKEIIRAHGGEIWAENNPDRGAKITFTLPVHEQDAPMLTMNGETS